MEALKEKIVVKKNNGKVQLVDEGGKIVVPDIPAVGGVINGKLRIDDGAIVDIDFRGDREELYFYWKSKPDYFFLLAEKKNPHTELTFRGDKLTVGLHPIGSDLNEVQADFSRHESTGLPKSESRGSLTVMSIAEEGQFDVIEGYFSFSYIDRSEKEPRDVVFSCPTFRLRVPK